MNPGSIEIFDLNTTHNYSRNIKAENPKQSVVYLTILWLECDCAFRLEMFHNLFHDISLVNAKIFKLWFERDSYPTRDKAPWLRFMKSISHLQIEQRKIRNSYKYKPVLRFLSNLFYSTDH